MVSPVVIALFVAVFLYGLFKFCTYRPPGFPPGPFRIPFFGSYLFLLMLDYENLHLAVEKLCKYFKTSVLGLYAGSYHVAIAMDQKSIREVFFNPDFDGRPDVLLGRLREPEYRIKGIFFTDGEYWNHQRRFTLRNLRDFGFGRRFEDFEAEIRDEMKNLVESFKDAAKFDFEKIFKRGPGEVCLPRALIGHLGNCYLEVLSGERLPRPEQSSIFKAGYGSLDFQINATEYGNLFGIVPWIRFFFPETSLFKQLRNGSMAMCDFMETIVDRQMKTYQDGHCRHFIDVYIKEMKEDGEKIGFLRDQLLMICTDFLFPSLSAIETQVSFLMRLLLHRRDVMRKIQDEIDAVVGHGRLPGLDDRINLPYTEATLREILRYETLVPMSVPHRAMKDTTLGGYQVPKDTIILAGLFKLHNDKEIWGDPENFRPERFLGDDGKLNVRKDFSLPFGAGRRLCAGETFARNTMFLCIAALMQNFNVKAMDGELPRLDEIKCGITRLPKDFWVKFEPR